MPNQRKGVIDRWHKTYGFIVEPNGQRWFFHRDDHPRHTNWQRSMLVTFDVVGANGRTPYVALVRPV